VRSRSPSSLQRGRQARTSISETVLLTPPRNRTRRSGAYTSAPKRSSSSGTAASRRRGALGRQQQQRNDRRVMLAVMQQEFTFSRCREDDHRERSRRYGQALSPIGEGGAVSVLVVVGGCRDDSRRSFRRRGSVGRVRMAMPALRFVDEFAVFRANRVGHQREVERAGELHRGTRNRDDDGRYPCSCDAECAPRVTGTTHARKGKGCLHEPRVASHRCNSGATVSGSRRARSARSSERDRYRCGIKAAHMHRSGLEAEPRKPDGDRPPCRGRRLGPKGRKHHRSPCTRSEDAVRAEAPGPEATRSAKRHPRAGFSRGVRLSRATTSSCRSLPGPNRSGPFVR
jgi:hypothetical protein